MAGNKFSSLLQKQCHKMTVILVYALVEWILILLLLLNALFTLLIAKFTTFFGLKPSCTWCSMLHKTSHLDHVCEAHATEISNISYCSTHNKLAQAKNLCARCSSPQTVAFFTCSCCDEMVDRKVYPESMDVILCKRKVGIEVDVVGKRSDGEECVINDDVQEWDSSQTGNEEDESVYIADMLLQSAEFMDSDTFICIELNHNAAGTGREGVDQRTHDFPAHKLTPQQTTDAVIAQGVEEEEELSGASSEIEGGVESVRATMAAQEKALTALQAELEEERRAAAEAAMEAMAMISKLQEEKAAMQMEAAQYQRMMEEQAEYDQEALQLLNDLMLKREKEKRELEKELQTYRANASNGNHSINLNDNEDEEEDDDIRDSLAEFEEERVSILEQVKVLEAKKLLPLFDEAEREDAMRKTVMEEELGHVYERLQALEADKDFLKHCIRSIMKGDKGMGLLHEILQHLRDLKSVEILATNMGMAQIPLQDALIKQEDSW